MKLEKNKLIPEKKMHLKDVRTNEIAEGYIYLGIYDSPENYVEVTEEEYQQWLIEKEIEVLEEK
jgi:hypothetical protein